MEQKKKFIDIKSLLIGVCLCFAIVLFVAGMKPQTSGGEMRADNATLNSLRVMEAKLNAQADQLNRMEAKIDKTYQDLRFMWKELYGLIKNKK